MARGEHATSAAREVRAPIGLDQLQELLEDTEMALGSDLMTASLEGYAVLKVSGKGNGLDGMRQALSARFNRGRKAETVVKDLQPA